jgi:tRNA (guanine37-N1)-methyltransferase
MMRCEVITLFPDLILQVLGQSMLKRAQEKGLLRVRVRNLRDFTDDRHQVADDTPYGGGAGMVMKAEPIFRAVDAVRQDYRDTGGGHSGKQETAPWRRPAETESVPEATVRLIVPSPQGRLFCQRVAEELRDEHRPIVFICGHYEGMDERVRLGLRPEEISIGDFVLTGGELPALVIIDAAVRLIPGVLGDPESAREDSFADSLLDYPHYTRPAEVRGLTVPDILLSGNHEAIRLWRRKEALRNTYLKRPDLLRDRVLNEADRRLLDDIVREGAGHLSVKCGEEG